MDKPQHFAVALYWPVKFRRQASKRISLNLVYITKAAFISTISPLSCFTFAKRDVMVTHYFENLSAYQSDFCIRLLSLLHSSQVIMISQVVIISQVTRLQVLKKTEKQKN
ncbi:CLUMA_CG010100, isoform A [Clunio marinus]|uniref:CLUMA_CG010100, isoform A n=1 Tax=Clunio marinus TaxID=568069 RepID=A0A1J1I8Z5_9DIPT|nr:CLUMA_CG010100, isoform A [Clunio marinus]